MNRSPIKKARYQSARIRRKSADVLRPLSLIDTTLEGSIDAMVSDAVEIDLQCPQIAVVDADDLSSGGQRALEFLPCCAPRPGCETEMAGRRRQPASSAIVECGDDQQAQHRRRRLALRAVGIRRR